MDLPDNRKLVDNIVLKDNTKYNLEYLGSGATCVCYKITDQGKHKEEVFKVFNPIDRSGRPLDSGSEQYKILKKRFCDMSVFDLVIQKQHQEQNEMDPITYDTEEIIDGNVGFRSRIPVPGETLKKHWEAVSHEDLDEKLKDLLFCIKSSLHELKIYHSICLDNYSYGILNADFKPSNLLYAHQGEGSYIVRNIDFGSCLNIVNIIDELYIIKGITDNNVVQNKIQEIKRGYIASTPNYYGVESPISDVNKVLEKCHSILRHIGDKDKAYIEAAKCIKLLDLKAVLIVFFERLWEIFDASNNINKYETLLKKLSESSSSLKYEKTYSDGDGNLFVRYNFVQKLANLEVLRRTYVDLVFYLKNWKKKQTRLQLKNWKKK